MTRNSARPLSLWALSIALWLSGAASAPAQEVFGGYGPGTGCSSCGVASCNSGHCQHTHCPPHLSHCMEGAPKICVKIGCPKPICNPCTQPNWGYYETCWSPWPFPPNYNHCPNVPPAATVALSGPNYNGAPNYNGTTPNYNGTVPYNGPNEMAQPPRQPAPPIVPSMPPTNQGPVRTTPMPGPAGPPNPLESLPIPRQESLRPTPSLDDF